MTCVWDLLEVMRFPGEGESAVVNVREVRRQVCAVVAESTLAVDLDDLAVMVSEVATNAIRYTASGRADGRLCVAVLLGLDRLRVEFDDDGEAETVPAIPEGAGEAGRGLGMVAALSTAWGYSVSDDARRGVTVWFELPATAGECLGRDLDRPGAEGGSVGSPA